MATGLRELRLSVDDALLPDTSHAASCTAFHGFVSCAEPTTSTLPMERVCKNVADQPSGPPVKSLSKPWRSIPSVMAPNSTPVVEPGVQGGETSVGELRLVDLEEAERVGE